MEDTQPDLNDAPPIRAVDELRVLRHATTTLKATVRGPLGLALEVQITDVPYDGLAGAASRAVAFEKALIAANLKPVTPVTAAPLPQSASAPQQEAPAQSEAVEIPATDGGPARCSLHGAMKWFEGNNGRAWWSCSHKNPDGKYCRPAKAKA